ATRANRLACSHVRFSRRGRYRTSPLRQKGSVVMRSKPNKTACRTADSVAVLHLKPLAQAIALLLLANSAQAATSFSAGWFAAKSGAQAAGPARPSAPRPGTPPPLAQQQRVQQQL